jgi:putative lipase involved disintegration of autophagic bodies
MPAEWNNLGLGVLQTITPAVAAQRANYPCHTLEVTGHSLGGVIADIIVVLSFLIPHI